MLKKINNKNLSLFLVTLVFTFSCQSNSKKDFPIISFENDTLRFGNLNTNDSLLFEYKFENSGTADLKILDVGADCGCTKPIYDTSSYIPNSKGIIKLKFISSGDTGKVIRTIVVKTNTLPSLKVLYLIGRVTK